MQLGAVHKLRNPFGGGGGSDGRLRKGYGFRGGGGWAQLRYAYN